MLHIVISDTHSPQCATKSLNHAKTVIKEHPEVDAIVINGDLLGSFSMRSSILHKGKNISKVQLEAYLQAGAPKFYSEWKKTGKITKHMLLQYAAERYQWCFDTIEEFSKVKFTIFNLGNHESKLHFLVLQELPFLTGCDFSVIEEADKTILEKIYDEWERQLYELEKRGSFSYIRNKHIFFNGSIIMGIPGESHGTVGSAPESIAQENKTKELIENVKKDIPKAHSIIIYNHTQANYKRENGSFEVASPSLKTFMNELPATLKRKIWVQSHNHWSYTQWINDGNFDFILNNTGLHDGIFNILDFNSLNFSVFDIDPNTKQIVSVNKNTRFENYKDEIELIGRYYDNVDYILERKGIRINRSIQQQSKQQTIQQPLSNLQPTNSQSQITKPTSTSSQAKPAVPVHA